MLHKAADCDAYWLAHDHDPADMALHTEDVVYYIADGEAAQDGDCKHNSEFGPQHLTRRDDRVEPHRKPDAHPRYICSNERRS